MEEMNCVKSAFHVINGGNNMECERCGSIKMFSVKRKHGYWKMCRNCGAYFIILGVKDWNKFHKYWDYQFKILELWKEV
jgi:hypothetical protein